MFYIEKMEIAPIVGYYNEDTIDLSKKVAEAYNSSISNLNYKKFLGFEFENINELKNNKANFNFEDRTLEIIINENTHIIVPSIFSESHHLSKYFEFDKKFKDDNMIIESLCESKNLLNEFNLKGSASRLATKVKKGYESTKNFFKDNVEIDQSEISATTISQIATNINKSLVNDLKFTDDNKQMIEQAITNFMTKGDAKSINEMYLTLYNQNFQTKSLDEVLNVVKEKIESSKIFGEIKGETLDKDLIQAVAKAYKVKVSAIKTRNGKDILYKRIYSFFKKIFKYTKNILGMCVDYVKGVISGAVAYEIFSEGILGLIQRLISFCIKNIITFLQYLFKPSSQRGQYEDALSKSQSIIDRIVASLSKANSALTEKVVDGLDFIKDIEKGLTEYGVEVTKQLKKIDFIGKTENLISALLFVLAAYYVYKIMKRLSEVVELDLASSTSNIEIAALFTKENLSNKFGFDKILATERIMYVIVSHLSSAIKNKKLSKHEIKNAKQIIKLINNSHKIKTAEGIKYFHGELSNLQDLMLP